MMIKQLPHADGFIAFHHIIGYRQSAKAFPFLDKMRTESTQEREREKIKRRKLNIKR